MALPQTLRLEVWTPTFNDRLTLEFPLEVGAVRVIDIGDLKNTNGLPAQQGIAIASVLHASGLPIHFNRVLAGNFTVANLTTGSAWGSPAVGRSARNVVDGTEPANGTIVDASQVAYQIIEPSAFALCQNWSFCFLSTPAN